MSIYNLTENQKDFLKSLVEQIRKKNLDEEFWVIWSLGEVELLSPKINKSFIINPQNFPQAELDVLTHKGLIILTKQSHNEQRYVITQSAYDAVDANFNEPDTSFIKYITPLTDVSNLDNELKQRCLSILSAGSSDPTLWDSAVRTAGVILEERLRTKGSINDSNMTGQTLVNKIFGNNGILASKFTIDSERQGYRDLYAGIIGAFRNPSAHRLIDPTPEEGGAFIMFVDLLLKKLDSL